MYMVAPRTGADEITLAEEQPEYSPLVAAKYEIQYDAGRPPAPGLLTRWRFTEEERARIAAGEDLYLGVLTFGKALQPLMLQVGPEGWEVEG